MIAECQMVVAFQSLVLVLVVIGVGSGRCGGGESGWRGIDGGGG